MIVLFCFVVVVVIDPTVTALQPPPLSPGTNTPIRTPLILFPRGVHIHVPARDPHAPGQVAMGLRPVSGSFLSGVGGGLRGAGDQWEGKSAALSALNKILRDQTGGWGGGGWVGGGGDRFLVNVI